jgi:hypothetical protein
MANRVFDEVGERAAHGGGIDERLHGARSIRDDLDARVAADGSASPSALNHQGARVGQRARLEWSMACGPARYRAACSRSTA